jgi:hypothetical protein
MKETNKREEENLEEIINKALTERRIKDNSELKRRMLSTLIIAIMWSIPLWIFGLFYYFIQK